MPYLLSPKSQLAHNLSLPFWQISKDGICSVNAVMGVHKSQVPQGVAEGYCLRIGMALGYKAFKPWELFSVKGGYAHELHEGCRGGSHCRRVSGCGNTPARRIK